MLQDLFVLLGPMFVLLALLVFLAGLGMAALGIIVDRDEGVSETAPRTPRTKP